MFRINRRMYVRGFYPATCQKNIVVVVLFLVCASCWLFLVLQAELILDLTEEVRCLQSTEEELQQKNQHIADLQQEVTRLQESLLSQRDLHASDVQQEDGKHHDPDPRQEVTRDKDGPSQLEEPTNEESLTLMNMETTQQACFIVSVLLKLIHA